MPYDGHLLRHTDGVLNVNDLISFNRTLFNWSDIGNLISYNKFNLFSCATLVNKRTFLYSICYINTFLCMEVLLVRPVNISHLLFTRLL